MVDLRADRPLLVSRRVVRAGRTVEHIEESRGGQFEDFRDEAARHEALKIQPVEVLQEPQVDPCADAKTLAGSAEEETWIRCPVETRRMLGPTMGTTGKQPGLAQ